MKKSLQHHILKQYTFKQSKIKGFHLYSDFEKSAVLTLSSKNSKTGDISQLTFFSHDKSKKENVCGNCKHLKTSCYVSPMSTASVRRAYFNNNYIDLPYIRYNQLEGLIIRYGADGDIGLFPKVFRDQLKDLHDRTLVLNYSHTWQDNPDLKKWTMASVDNLQEYDRAKDMGFRTYRATNDLNTIQPNEIVCPNFYNPLIQCKDCFLCDGRPGKKDILIKAHGSPTKQIHFLNNIQ